MLQIWLHDMLGPPLTTTALLPCREGPVFRDDAEAAHHRQINAVERQLEETEHPLRPARIGGAVVEGRRG